MNVAGHLMLGRIHLKPGEDWPETSAGWRLIRISEGEGYWLGRETRRLSAGQVVVVEPGAKGVIRASQLNSVLLDAFDFVPQLFYGFLTIGENHFFEVLQARNENRGAGVRILDAQHAAAQKFSKLVSGQTDARRGIEGRANALAVIGAVFDDDIRQLRTKAKRYSPALQKFQDIMAEMPDSEILRYDPQELAARCGCSTRHFNRLFRKHFGSSANRRRTTFLILHEHYTSLSPEPPRETA